MPLRSAAMADGGECALGAFAALPSPIVLAVLALLPVDARLRCREVCKGWHAALNERSLWARVDLSEASGVAAAHLEWRRAARLLAAAALRAGGQLQSIDVTAVRYVNFTALRDLAAGHAATLRELRVAHNFSPADLLADLLRAAPQLQLLHAQSLHVDDYEALEVMRDEQLFAPLRVHALFAASSGTHDAALLALALRLVAATAAAELYFEYVDLSEPAAVVAVLDAAHLLSVVSLDGCRLSAAAAPALARLLRGGAVTTLVLAARDLGEELWADEAGAALVCDALRANTSLRELQIAYLEAWAVPAAATALLTALVGHPSVRKLELYGNNHGSAPQAAAATAALGALMAADTLTHLDVSYCSMGDAELGPLFDALPGVTRLRTLLCFAQGNEAEDARHELSDAFVRDRALPAVRANASLRELGGGYGHNPRASMREAEELVSSRG